MNNSRRNVLKALIALVTLPIAKLASAKPYEFNRSHALSYEMMAEVKKGHSLDESRAMSKALNARVKALVDEIDATLKKFRPPAYPFGLDLEDTPTYVQVTTFPSTIRIGFVWDVEMNGKRQGCSTDVPVPKWPNTDHLTLAKVVARTLKFRYNIKRPVDMYRSPTKVLNSMATVHFNMDDKHTNVSTIGYNVR